MKVGVAVTTRNRPDVLKRCLDNILEHSPDDFVVAVVDDASDTPVEVQDGVILYRFDENAGIPRAKNKCIEILIDEGCDELFLFDDDTWPKRNNWWKPYVENEQPHLMYIFTAYGNQRSGIRKLGIDTGRNLARYSHFRGCMLYLNKSVVEKVGGMRKEFGVGGFEHSEYSDRIHRNGLTRFRSQDILNSDKYIYSADEHLEVASTFTQEARDYWFNRNRPLKFKFMAKKGYVDYRE